MAGEPPHAGVLTAVCEGTDTAFGPVSSPGVPQTRRVVVQEDAVPMVLREPFQPHVVLRGHPHRPPAGAVQTRSMGDMDS